MKDESYQEWRKARFRGNPQCWAARGPQGQLPELHPVPPSEAGEVSVEPGGREGGSERRNLRSPLPPLLEINSHQRNTDQLIILKGRRKLVNPGE